LLQESNIAKYVVQNENETQRINRFYDMERITNRFGLIKVQRENRKTNGQVRRIYFESQRNLLHV